MLWIIKEEYIEANDLRVEEIINDMLWDDEDAKEKAYEMYQEMVTD